MQSTKAPRLPPRPSPKANVSTSSKAARGPFSDCVPNDQCVQGGASGSSPGVSTSRSTTTEPQKQAPEQHAVPPAPAAAATATGPSAGRLEGPPEDVQQQLQHRMQAAMQGLASGQHRGLLEALSQRMGMSPEQLMEEARAVARGDRGAMPPAVLQRALQMQQAAAAAAATATDPPHGSAPGGAMGPIDDETGGIASWEHAPPASLPSRLDLAGVEEAEQGWLELYSRAYLRHADAFYPPVFVGTAVAAFWTGLLPFWLALPGLPLLFAAGIHWVLIKGG